MVRALPDDACPACGTTMKAASTAVPWMVNGEKVIVRDVPHSACASCGEVMFRYAEAKAAQRKAAEAYRESHALLSAKEIRALRQGRGLTQAEFAALLHLGLNTVSRWESGRNVQNAAMDVLLRIVRDVPPSFDYLKKLAA
jgi:putative zinc finger/helix-turn-helix YgiT family protein